jgi:hypothetical protein
MSNNKNLVFSKKPKLNFIQDTVDMAKKHLKTQRLGLERNLKLFWFARGVQISVVDDGTVVAPSATKTA